MINAASYSITSILAAKNLGETFGNIRGELTDIVTSQCFVAGTLVLTEDGEKPIEDIEVSDYVYSTDPETGESDYKEVLNVFIRQSNIIIHIFVNGEEIETTPTHPFWVEDEWVPADKLKAGDVLTLADGTTCAIDRVYAEFSDKAITVYNFEVADFHSYYVTDTGVLVHNADGYVGNNKTAKNGEIPNKNTLYHFTNEEGMNAIITSQELRPSLKANNPKDARYGDGQYLSDINPNTTTPARLARSFINIPNKYKYTHYVEIDVAGLDILKGREGVFVIPNKSPLDLIGRIVSSGKVGSDL